MKLKPIVEKNAIKNMSDGGGDKKSGRQKSDNPIMPIRTDEELAKTAGVSRDSILSRKKYRYTIFQKWNKVKMFIPTFQSP